jgi:hypothetical protein
MGIERVSTRKQGVMVLSQHFTTVKTPRSLGNPSISIGSSGDLHFLHRKCRGVKGAGEG